MFSHKLHVVMSFIVCYECFFTKMTIGDTRADVGFRDPAIKSPNFEFLMEEKITSRRKLVVLQTIRRMMLLIQEMVLMMLTTIVMI